MILRVVVMATVMMNSQAHLRRAVSIIHIYVIYVHCTGKVRPRLSIRPVRRPLPSFPSIPNRVRALSRRLRHRLPTLRRRRERYYYGRQVNTATSVATVLSQLPYTLSSIPPTTPLLFFRLPTDPMRRRLLLYYSLATSSREMRRYDTQIHTHTHTPYRQHVYVTGMTAGFRSGLG